MLKKPLVITYGKPDGYHDVHVGHLSGVVLHADAYARYCRTTGRETWLISGTDGYGVTVYWHAFQALGNVPTEQELRAYVEKYHRRQYSTLTTYHVLMDYFGLDTDLEETNRIQKLCDNVLYRLQATGNCMLRKEIQYYDPVLKCPLGNRNLIKELNDRRVQYRSKITGVLTQEVPVENWYVSLEKYRSVIEASLQRFSNSASDKYASSFVLKMLREPLPDYRLTSHQPWAVKVDGSDSMKYQVWVGSLLAPAVYLQQVTKKQVIDCQFVQFIAEDTLFFYTIIQPVLWHTMWPNLPLPTLVCNCTRKFIDETGQSCFMTGDELLQQFTVEQIRTCMISRGTRHTTIALSKQEMDRLWKGYIRAITRMTILHGEAKIRATQLLKDYEICLQQMNFSKAANIADEYFHTSLPDQQTCITMMHYIIPDYPYLIQEGREK